MMLSDTRRWILATLAAMLPLAGMAQPSTAFQLDAGHTGATQFSPPLALPLVERWRVELPSYPGYPVIADGRVFVVSGGRRPAEVHAFDAATGRPLWQRVDPERVFWGALTHGDGGLFLSNGWGSTTRIDPADGRIQWHLAALGDNVSPPTYHGGSVYLSIGGTYGFVMAIDAELGTARWVAAAGHGERSSPAVSDLAVYTAYTCPSVLAVVPATGADLWLVGDNCLDYGGATPVLAPEIGLVVRDRVLQRTFQLDAATGQLKAMGPWSKTIQAAVGKRLYGVSQNGQLFALEGTGNRRLWTARGTGVVITAPIVVDGVIFVGDARQTLWAVDAATGEVLWSTPVGQPIQPTQEDSTLRPLAGLAAGEGLVIVPAGNWLIAYGRP